MKKILYFAALLFGFTFASCSKEDIGGTATESMAGDWYVTVEAVAEDGTVIDDDFNGGRVHMLTYNTADNVATSMYIDDLGTEVGEFLGMKAKITCNPSAMTFASEGTVANETSHSKYVSDQIQIMDGKILLKAGRQNNGSVADSIDFYMKYTEDAYANAYGYTKYHIHGVRYSGLVENDD
jgi:hypothetical protein